MRQKCRATSGSLCAFSFLTGSSCSCCYAPTRPVSRSDALSYTHTFNGPLSGTTQVSRYQKGETNLDFTEARDSEWQWHQLGHMQVCTSLRTDKHASTPPLSFYRLDALPATPNQQRQSTNALSLLITTASIRPHRYAKHKMRPVATDSPSVCWSQT